MKNIYLITGNKGGIGKTFTSILLSDYLIRNTTNQKLYFSDCESANGQGTFFNFMHNNTNDLIYNWDLTTDYGYEKMINDIDIFEDNSSIVVDTGASMLYRLNENSSFLSYINENGNFNINIIFIVGSLKDSSVSARLFIKSFMSYKNIKSSFLLIASTATESAERSFDFENQEDIQRVLVELNMKKYFFEYVQQNYFDLIMKNFMLPCKIISNKEIPFGTRSKFNLWLKIKSDPIFQDIVAGQDIASQNP